MKIKRTIFILLFLALLFLGAYFFVYNKKKLATVNDAKVLDTTASSSPVLPVEEKKVDIAVEAGDIWNKVGARAGLNNNACYTIYDSAKNVYDLAKLVVGNKFSFYSDADNQINKIVYNTDDSNELYIEKSATSTDWQASLIPINYEIKEKTIEGSIDASSSSLYLSALAQSANEGMIIQFAENLEYSIDFASDPKIGDKYKFIYEERYRGGKFVMPGRVLAGAYLNGDKLYQTFYFVESADNKGYYDANGNAVQKMFLKAPLSFKYISSPFTTGSRYIEAFNMSTGHRAVDYAATYGTPIRAVGDGTVVFVGRDGPYGNKITIKHNSTYSTNYCHQSKFAVKKGQKVKQGQVIGYVGSTGLSTGPHLHFEMVRNGVKVNPASVIQPPGKPISAAKKAGYMALVEKMKEKIKI